jgi:hypothetical protein
VVAAVPRSRPSAAQSEIATAIKPIIAKRQQRNDQNTIRFFPMLYLVKPTTAQTR